MTCGSVTDLASNGFWPPKIGEHLAILYENGVQIGEVVGSDGNSYEKIETPYPNDEVTIKLYSKYMLEIHSNLSLWQDVDSKTLIVDRANVMQVRPQIEVVPSLS